MKKILFIALLLVNTFLLAQSPGVGFGGGRPQQNDQDNNIEIKEFKASDAVGIFYYDIEEVIKKIKVKDDDLTFKVKKALKNYNFKVKEIAFLNSEKLNDLDKLMSSLKNLKRNNLQNNSSDESEDMRTNNRKILRPIKEEIQIKEKVLNQYFIEILSEKQNKKWIKYQNNIKENLQPKRPERNQNNNRQRQRGNGQQQRRF